MTRTCARRHRHVVALATAAIVASTAPVFGQKPAVTDAAKPGWTIVPSLGVSAVWDDNVLLFQRLAEPPGDYLTGVSPAIALDYVGRYNRFTGRYDAGIQRYRTLVDLNSLEQRAHTQFGRRLTPHLSWFARDSFTRAPTTALPRLQGAPYLRVGSRVNDLVTGVLASVTRRTAVRASYGFSWVSFKRETAAARHLPGGRTHDFDVAVDEQVAPRLKIGGGYQYHYVIIAGGAETFGIQGVGGTIAFDLSPTVTMTAGAGVDRLGASQKHPSNTGPSWRAGVAHSTPRLTAELTYTRSLVPSFVLGGTTKNQDASGSIRTPIRPGRVYWETRAGWTSTDALTTDRPSLRTLGFSVTLGYAVHRYLRMEGFYDRGQQNTREAGGRIERTRLGFQIVTSRPMRTR